MSQNVRSSSPPAKKPRCLDRNHSDPKTENPNPRRPALPVKGMHQTQQLNLKPQALRNRLLDMLMQHGVPFQGHDFLLPLLERFGEVRAQEVLNLWTFLGDGSASRPVSTPTLQVWGPAGSGKTEVVSAFLQQLGLRHPPVRHIRLNCACFASSAELQGRLVEELRRLAVRSAPEPPRELLRPAGPGHCIRALDRLETALQPSLDFLRQRHGYVTKKRGLQLPFKVVVVLDQAEELPRLGQGLLQHLLSLPEVLKQGAMLTIVTISRLPLSLLGLLPAREPPSVEFPAYTEAQVEELLPRLLASAHPNPNAPDLRTLCSSGLVKGVVPVLGWNLHHLLQIGKEALEDTRFPTAGGSSLAALQRRMDRAVQERSSLCDLRSLLEPGEDLDPQEGGARATLRRLTKEEQRLLLAAYLGAHVAKEDDAQLFLPEGRRRCRKRGAATKRSEGLEAELPVYARAPQPVPLVRLLAIYHRLAHEPFLVGPLLFERLMKLREAGFLRFAGERQPCSERELKVLCRVELQLARACAGDLGIDLAEYLDES